MFRRKKKIGNKKYALATHFTVHFRLQTAPIGEKNRAARATTRALNFVWRCVGGGFRH